MDRCRLSGDLRRPEKLGSLGAEVDNGGLAERAGEREGVFPGDTHDGERRLDVSASFIATSGGEEWEPPSDKFGLEAAVRCPVAESPGRSRPGFHAVITTRGSVSTASAGVPTWKATVPAGRSTS